MTKEINQTRSIKYFIFYSIIFIIIIAIAPLLFNTPEWFFIIFIFIPTILIMIGYTKSMLNIFKKEQI